MLNTKERISFLRKQLENLKQADPNFTIFGSDKHYYKRKPKITEEELAIFERNNKISLPTKYRDFLFP